MTRKKNIIRGLREDDIVRDLIPDPSKLPKTRVFVGFLGKASRTGFLRLYFTETFTHYIEFRKNDMTHSRPLSKKKYPIGGTMVWIRQKARLRYSGPKPYEGEAEFLKGGIASEFLAGTSMQTLPGPGVRAIVTTIPCIVASVMICPTTCARCPSGPVSCLTRRPVCDIR
jgi:hypothetical protein